MPILLAQSAIAGLAISALACVRAGIADTMATRSVRRALMRIRTVTRPAANAAES